MNAARAAYCVLRTKSLGTLLIRSTRRAVHNLLLIAALALAPGSALAQHLLVPMDDEQQNHLKAYGLTFQALKDGLKAEWLLNYRGGAFLLPDVPELRRRAGVDGVSFTPIDGGQLAEIRSEMAGANMDAIPLERAPRVAVYTPPDAPPWDDAVTLALKYAGIDYTGIYDDEVERGDLSKYDWLHLHHEDFTGQLNKFHIAYAGAPWFVAASSTSLVGAMGHNWLTMPTESHQNGTILATRPDDVPRPAWYARRERQ
jgi:hypothetical protein